jgi:hypothetical protein
MPKPSPIALVVCDNVYVDSTGKRALIGLFNRIHAPSEGPIVQRRMCVYISMTEVYPGTRFSIDIVHAETDQAVVRAESPSAPAGTDPTTIFDFQFQLNNLKFPEAGSYYVRFLADNEILLQRPIQIVRARKQGTDT